MLIAIPGLLPGAAVAAIRAHIDSAAWIDGRVTAGAQSARAKHNTQLPEDSPAARIAGDAILDALAANPTFLSAALPLKIFPPLFSRYAPADRFGLHVDNAIRPVRGQPVRVRTDLAMTVFLAPADSYGGGELVVETRFGAQEIKLEAGDAVLYPASSLHRVAEVTHGMRVASFLWLQSMVRDDGARELLFDLDQSIQSLTAARGADDADTIRLSGVYHNLVRRWAET